MIDPGTIIDGRYTVISRVGSGGMADVYLAEDELLGRKVAVKVLHHHFAEDAEFVERFRREASSAAGLSHPNVVSVFDRGEWNETYYIAMEYLPGRSLKAMVREQGALDPASAIDIVIQVLRATRFAHRRGVIHRDLKPHNVILDEEGRAKVTDFGIARAGASDMTLTGSIMGTAQYLSPEQAQGHAVSETSDLYAIGVILYELLTGSVPFDGETAVAIALKQVSAEPKAPSELAPGVPAALDEVVLRALAKDPALRFADADEFILALQGVRTSLPTPVGEHALAAAASWPRGVASPALERTFVSGARPGGGALLQAPAHPPPQELALPGANVPPDSPPGLTARLRRRWLWIASALTLLIVAAALLLLLGGSKAKVPDLIGRSEVVAFAMLRHSGLKPIRAQAPSSTVGHGLVSSSDPSAGHLLAEGSTVRVTISTGPAQAAVPSVIGLTRAEALARLSDHGFKPVVKLQQSASVPRGAAIGTIPASGSAADLGGRVTLLLSSGPTQIRVPDVTGSTKEAASAELEAAGFKLGPVTEKPSKAHPPGTVLSQTPAGGGLAPSGSEVSLETASAPPQVVVPSVVGENGETAVEMLQSSGFTVTQTPSPVTDPVLVGLVVKQAPAAGHRVRKGATITLAVGTAQTSTSTTSSTTSSSTTSSTQTTTTSSTTTPAPPP